MSDTPSGPTAERIAQWRTFAENPINLECDYDTGVPAQVCGAAAAVPELLAAIDERDRLYRELWGAIWCAPPQEYCADDDGEHESTLNEARRQWKAEHDNADEAKRLKRQNAQLAHRCIAAEEAEPDMRGEGPHRGD